MIFYLVNWKDLKWFDNEIRHIKHW